MRLYFFSFCSILLLSIFTSCAKISIDKTPVYSRQYQVGAYLWFQTSGEYRALCYQAYNLAKLKLDLALLNKNLHKLAVVFDIDETVLDNSVFGAEELVNNAKWDKDNLNNWVKKQSAQAIPGAADFIKYASSRGVEVIYISNRFDWQAKDTFENLAKLNIPAKIENFYFLKDGWSKEARRLEVQKKYNVVLYLGDNLQDFHKDWDKKSSQERRILADQHFADFGDRFIIIPNPLYGDWENSLPKVEDRLKLLKTRP